MTAEHILRFFNQIPFEPFTVVLASGHEVQIHHPEAATVGEHVASVYVIHPTGQFEVIASDAIVSIRTSYATNPDNWIR